MNAIHDTRSIDPETPPNAEIGRSPAGVETPPAATYLNGSVTRGLSWPVTVRDVNVNLIALSDTASNRRPTPIRLFDKEGSEMSILPDDAPFSDVMEDLTGELGGARAE